MKQTPDKSDWTDAKLLADLTRTGYLPRVWFAPQYLRDLRELVRHRHGLVQQRTQVKLRLRAVLRKPSPSRRGLLSADTSTGSTAGFFPRIRARRTATNRRGEQTSPSRSRVGDCVAHGAYLQFHFQRSTPCSAGNPFRSSQCADENMEPMSNRCTVQNITTSLLICVFTLFVG